MNSSDSFPHYIITHNTHLKYGLIALSVAFILSITHDRGDFSSCLVNVAYVTDLISTVAQEQMI